MSSKGGRGSAKQASSHGNSPTAGRLKRMNAGRARMQKMRASARAAREKMVVPF